MVKKFEEFISEQLWSKGIERSKSDKTRKEELNGLTQDEYKLYQYFKEWTTNNPLNINTSEFKKNNGKPYEYGRKFPKDFISNIKSSNITTRLYEWPEISKALKQKQGIIYTDKNFDNIVMIYLDDDNYIMDLSTTFYRDMDMSYTCLSKMKRNDVSDYEKKHNIPYNAYSIPINVLIRVFEQQGTYNSVRNFYN